MKTSTPSQRRGDQLAFKKISPTSPLPVNLGGAQDELSARQQPEACRRLRPRDGSVVSASDLRLGSHEMWWFPGGAAAGAAPESL